MEDVKPSNRWIVRGRRVLVILLLLVLVVLGVRAVLDAWMGRRLTNAIARLEKDYGPLRWDPVRKLDAWRRWPRRTAPDNRARILDAAAASITASNEKMELALMDAGTPIPKGKVAHEIAEQNRQAVQLAIKATGLRHSNWGVSFVGEVYNVPNLLNHHLLSKALIAAAQHDADAGRADDAMAALAAGFAQAAAVGAEPARVMTVNAFGMVSNQINALKDVLDRSEPSDTALAGLAAAVDENLASNPAREALLGELKHARATWPLVERGWLWGRRSVDDHVPTPPTAWMRAIGWLGRPVIRYLAIRDLEDRARVVDAANTPRTRRPKEALPSSTRFPGERLSALQLAAGLIEGGDRSLAQLGLTASAVALRRFRLEHGAYPNALDELVPVYLKAVPLDPFNGRPFEYQREGTGFVLRARFPELRPAPGAIHVQGYGDPAEWTLTR